MSGSLVKIGLLQHACGTDPAANLEKALAAAERAADQGAQIISTQELFRSQYFCQTEDHRHFKLAEPIPGPSTEAFQKLARQRQVVIIASLFEKRAAGLYHNTAAVIDADGSLLGCYRKMHIPDDPLYYEKFYFTPGEKAGQGELQHSAWETIQRSHAVANGCYIAVPNRVGHEKLAGDGLEFWGQSFVAGTSGEVLAQATVDQEEILVVPLDLSQVDDTRTHWPFLRDRRIDAYGDLTKRFIS